MTAKQKLIIIAAILILVAAAVFTVCFLFFKEPEKTPDGVLVYKEAYMRMADQPWQGERLCQRK